MEKVMLGISRRDRIPDKEIRRRTGVTDVVKRITTQKWSLAEHVARLTNERRTKKIIEWKPKQEAYRYRGRPPTRWTDDIKRIKTADCTTATNVATFAESQQCTQTVLYR